MAGLLKRVHGGALPLSPNPLPYLEREKWNISSKKSLARAARELVQNGKLVILGSGTTNAEIARNLPADLRATIVTPSPQAALYLAQYRNVEVILIGGRLQKVDLVAVDSETISRIRDFQADICFLGVCSLHPQVGLTANVYEEVELERTIIEQSAEVVVVVTAEKMGTIAPFVVAPIDQITHIVTESQVPPDSLAHYESLGIRVIRAD